MALNVKQVQALKLTIEIPRKDLYKTVWLDMLEYAKEQVDDIYKVLSDFENSRVVLMCKESAEEAVKSYLVDYFWRLGNSLEKTEPYVLNCIKTEHCTVNLIEPAE